MKEANKVKKKGKKARKGKIKGSTERKEGIRYRMYGRKGRRKKGRKKVRK